MSAVQVVSEVVYFEDLAVPAIVPDPILHPRVAGAVALEPAVDDVGGEPEPRRPVGLLVGLGGHVPPQHHVVARRLGLLRRHPEPQRRLERHIRIARHHLRVPQPVEAQRLPRRPVVVVPGELHGSAAVV